MTDAQPSWLVTGAQGFLGTNIGAWLEGRAHRVGAARVEGASPLFDASIAADLLDPEPIVTWIRERRPDVVLHCAALAYHDRCEREPELARAVNVAASVALAQAAAAADSRFVFISTDAVFDGAHGHYSEDDTVSPVSVYGRTKADAEIAVASEVDALIVRTNFFGWSPMGRRSILEFFVNSLSAGQRVNGFTDFTTSSAYAQELSSTIWDLVDTGAAGTFHVTSPDAMTKYEFGVAVAEAFGLDTGLITPTRADIEPPRDGDISLDVGKVEAALGRQLPTMRAGIAQALADATTLRPRLRSLSADE